MIHLKIMFTLVVNVDFLISVKREIITVTYKLAITLKVRLKRILLYPMKCEFKNNVFVVVFHNYSLHNFKFVVLHYIK